MKTGAVIGAIVIAIAVGFGIYMIDIDQTQEARLPEVKIEGGQAPEFDADVGSIETGTREVTIEVPTVSINAPEDDDVVASN